MKRVTPLLLLCLAFASAPAAAESLPTLHPPTGKITKAPNNASDREKAAAKVEAAIEGTLCTCNEYDPAVGNLFLSMPSDSKAPPLARCHVVYKYDNAGMPAQELSCEKYEVIGKLPKGQSL